MVWRAGFEAIVRFLRRRRGGDCVCVSDSDDSAAGLAYFARAGLVLVGSRRAQQCNLPDAKVPQHAGGYAGIGDAPAGRPKFSSDADRFLPAQVKSG